MENKRNTFIPSLYAIGKNEKPPHVQAHLLLRASAPKELSVPHRHPDLIIIFILI